MFVCAALAGALASPRPAAAHGGGVLDLEALEELVDDRVFAAVGREFRIYRSLDRALAREIEVPLVDELAKLRAVARACRTQLSADAELVALLANGLGQADVRLAEEPAQAAAIVRSLERPGDRAAVLAMAGDAEADAASGRAAHDDVERAARFLESAKRFAKAGRLARKLIAKQIRRGSPGQPLEPGDPGTIDTFAGSGAPGFDPAPRPALQASFYFPADVAIDPATGRLHVADLNNNQIRMLREDGAVAAAVGTGALGDELGTAAETKLHHPTGVAWDPRDGAMVISGWHSSRILRVDAATTIVSYLSGDGTLGFAGDGGPVLGAILDYPSCVAFASDGAFFIGDQGNRRVRAVSAAGAISTICGTGATGFAGDGGPAAQAELSLPGGDTAEPAGRVCMSPDGRWLYVADTDNHRVRRIDLGDPQKTITTFAGDGTAASAGDGGPAVAASLWSPVDVECDDDGNVFVCERDGCRVRRIDAGGTITTVAGSGVRGFDGDGGPATAAELDGPVGICVDRVRGRLYIADTLNHVIRVVWE
ncbi:MAG: hypothetical protein HMLKMBBP_00568 [Planctomycetes bacterium]|nr:hypothetical protein [Planctomycetota bacterium]